MPAAAEALTANAADLMARYGIDRALLAADRPETDQPASRISTCPPVGAGLIQMWHSAGRCGTVPG
jgi:hypothetical protein